MRSSVSGAASLASAHAIAWLAAERPPGGTTSLLCLSGRGDKDLAEVLSRQGSG